MKKNEKYIYLTGLIIISFNYCFSQDNNPFRAAVIYANYSYDFPKLDMKKRFGESSEIGFGFFYKNRNNYVFGIENNFIFGDKIYENNILDSISTASGAIIGVDGLDADVRFFERGYKLPVFYIGKIIGLRDSNSATGIFITTGIGYLQHKIKIEDISRTAPQLDDEYKKGYDRLSGGIALTISAGYIHLNPGNWFNFLIATEGTLAFTRSMRTYNYDTRTQNNDKRMDFLLGLKVAIFIPVYREGNGDKYYYN